MKLSPNQLEILERLLEVNGTKGVVYLMGYFRFAVKDWQGGLPGYFMSLQPNCRYDEPGSYYLLLTPEENPSRVSEDREFVRLFPPAMLEMGFVEEAMLAAQLLREIEE